MTNYRKQLTAKTAWAQLTEENRRLREALEQILKCAAEGSVSPRAALSRVRQLASAALSAKERQAA